METLIILFLLVTISIIGLIALMIQLGTLKPSFKIEQEKFTIIIAISGLIVSGLTLLISWRSFPVFTPAATSTPTQQLTTPTIRPTNTLLLTPQTPIPTYTSILTPTQMNTPTATPTQTNTPTATPTETNTPTATLDITPELTQAKVTATEGLYLRTGPGINYEIIRILRNGEALNILGRNTTSDWIKVTLDDSTILGWVSTAYVEIDSNLIDINVVESPPTPTPTPVPTPIPTAEFRFKFGPKLFEPRPFTSYPVGEIIRFSWEKLPLLEQDYYSIRVVRDDLTENNACIHVQSREPEIDLTLDCPAGTYYWSVVVVTRLLIKENIFEWQMVSELNERNPFAIGIPHPNKPSDNPDINNVPPDTGIRNPKG